MKKISHRFASIAKQEKRDISETSKASIAARLSTAEKKIKKSDDKIKNRYFKEIMLYAKQGATAICMSTDLESDDVYQKLVDSISGVVGPAIRKYKRNKKLTKAERDAKISQLIKKVTKPTVRKVIGKMERLQSRRELAEHLYAKDVDDFTPPSVSVQYSPSKTTKAPSKTPSRNTKAPSKTPSRNTKAPAPNRPSRSRRDGPGEIS